MRLPRLGSAVVVCWMDSEIVAEWTGPDFAPAPHQLETRGRLVGVDAGSLRIAPTCALHDGGIVACLGIVAIPRGSVLSVEVE